MDLDDGDDDDDADETLHLIAVFLYENAMKGLLDKEGVGDFISASSSGVLNEEQHKQLLRTFCGLLSFKGVSFMDSVRQFLNDSGFAIPKEAAKIERLIEAFSKVFVRDHPELVSDESKRGESEDQVMVLVHSLLMLNTSLHNPRATQGNQLKRRQFRTMLSSSNAGLFCCVMFHAFCKCDIQTNKQETS